MLCDRAVILCALLGWMVGVHAQSVTLCNGPSTTISSNADATRLASCQIYNGSVVIAKNMTGIVNLNGVQQISGALTCKNATGVISVAASSLRSVGGLFELENLAYLSSLEFPSLITVGSGLHINKTSTNLTAISGFPRLTSVGGSMHLGGAFSSITFNNLRNVSGDAILKTSSTNATLCVVLTVAARQQRIIKGQVTCLTNDTSSLADIPLPASPESSNQRLSAGAITGIVVGAVFGALLIAGLILWLCHFRPKRQRKQGAVFTKAKQDPNEAIGSDEVTEYYGYRPEVVAATPTRRPSDHAYESYQHKTPTPTVNQTSAPAPAPPVPSGLRSHQTSFPTYNYNAVPVPPSPVSEVSHRPAANHASAYPASSRYSDDFDASRSMYDPPRQGPGFERTTSPRADMMEYQQAQARLAQVRAERTGLDPGMQRREETQLGKPTISPVPSILRPGRTSQGRGTIDQRTMRDV